MAPTPRPAGWKGGGEDFGFLRTFDGHRAPNLVGTPDGDDERFGYSNVRWGFDDADIGGKDYDCYPLDEDRD